MDDLLLFMATKKSHMAKLKHYQRHYSKMDLRYPQRNSNFSEGNYNTWATQFLLKTEEYVSNLCKVD